MARLVNEEEYAAKRNQILDVAQRLIYTKGYEPMTIQDVLDGMQMSKGAFYHYFRSKPALLEAMVERTVDQIEQVLSPIVTDPDLPALEKLRRFFARGSSWKAERKTLMFALMRVWYNDENAVVRQKVVTTALVRLGPLLSAIFHQGLREGVMNTGYPDEVGGLFYSVFQNIGEPFMELVLSPNPAPDRLLRLQRIFGLYSDVLERMLGAPPGSLPIVDEDALKEWLVAPEAADVPAELMTVS
jgi:TetR/AcrR family transcriptional repressor of nem operon